MSNEPNQADVDALRGLLDLMANFESNDQRARFLLSSDWMRDRGAAKVANRERVAEVATKAILYNLPIDAFGDEKRLKEYAAIWGNAACNAMVVAGVFRDEVQS